MRNPWCSQCPDSGPGGSGCLGAACRWTEWTDDGSVLVDDGRSSFGGTGDGYPALVRAANGRYVTAWLKCCARQRSSPFSFEQTENSFRYECEVLDALAGSPFAPRCLVRARTDAARVRAAVMPAVKGDAPRRTWTAAYGADTTAVWYAMTRAPGRPWSDYHFGGGFRRPLLLLCRALVDFHQRGFGHYDLKPDNIHYDPESGFLQLVDFGFAKGTAAWRADPAHRNDAAVEAMKPGSLPWVAPEHYRSRFLDLTPQSDDYVFGLIFVQAALDETDDWISQRFTAGSGRQAHPVAPSRDFCEDLYLRLARRTSDTVAQLVVYRLLAGRPEVRSGALENLLAELHRLGWDRGDGERASVSLPWRKIGAAAAAVAAVAAAIAIVANVDFGGKSDEGPVISTGTGVVRQSSVDVGGQKENGNNDSEPPKPEDLRKIISGWERRLPSQRKDVLLEMSTRWSKGDGDDQQKILAFYRKQSKLWPNARPSDPRLVKPGSLKVAPYTDGFGSWSPGSDGTYPFQISWQYTTGFSSNLVENIRLFADSHTVTIPPPPPTTTQPPPREPTVQEIVEGWKRRYNPFASNSALLGEMREYWDNHSDANVRQKILDFYCEQGHDRLWPAVEISHPERAKTDTLGFSPPQTVDGRRLNLSLATVPTTADSIALQVTGTYVNGAAIDFIEEIPLFSDQWTVTIPAFDIQNVIDQWKNQYAAFHPSYSSILSEMNDWWEKSGGPDKSAILAFYKDRNYSGLWPRVTFRNDVRAENLSLIPASAMENVPDLSKMSSLRTTSQNIPLTITGTYPNGTPVNVLTNIDLFSDHIEIVIPSPPVSEFEQKCKEWTDNKVANRDDVLRDMMEWWNSHNDADKKKLYDWYRSPENRALWPEYEIEGEFNRTEKRRLTIDETPKEDVTIDETPKEDVTQNGRRRIQPPPTMPASGRYGVTFSANWTKNERRAAEPSITQSVQLFQSAKVIFELPSAPKELSRFLETTLGSGSLQGVIPASISEPKTLYAPAEAPASYVQPNSNWVNCRGSTFWLDAPNAGKVAGDGDSVFYNGKEIGNVSRILGNRVEVGVRIDERILPAGRYCTLSREGFSISTQEQIENRWKEADRSKVIDAMKALSAAPDSVPSWVKDFWKNNNRLWPVVKVENKNAFSVCVKKTDQNPETEIDPLDNASVRIWVEFGSEKIPWTPEVEPVSEAYKKHKSGGSKSVDVSWDGASDNWSVVSVSVPTFTAPTTTTTTTTTTTIPSIDSSEAKTLFSQIRKQLGQPKRYMQGFFGIGKEQRGSRSFVQQIDRFYPNISPAKSLRQYAEDHPDVWDGAKPFTEEEWGEIEDASPNE